MGWKGTESAEWSLLGNNSCKHMYLELCDFFLLAMLANLIWRGLFQ